MPNHRPKLQLVTPTASPEEAAAVMAAVERFLRDHAPVFVAAEEPVSGWVRAARAESVQRDPDFQPWG